jgi:hypothetical protein
VQCEESTKVLYVAENPEKNHWCQFSLLVIANSERQPDMNLKY